MSTREFDRARFELSGRAIRAELRTQVGSIASSKSFWIILMALGPGNGRVLAPSCLRWVKVWRQTAVGIADTGRRSGCIRRDTGALFLLGVTRVREVFEQRACPPHFVPGASGRWTL